VKPAGKILKREEIVDEKDVKEETGGCVNNATSGRRNAVKTDKQEMGREERLKIRTIAGGRGMQVETR
jgi:hypothetical protein